MNPTPNPPTAVADSVDDDFSYYYTFFHDAPAAADMSPDEKRRGDDTTTNGKAISIARLLTSLASIETQSDLKSREEADASQHDLSLLHHNHIQKAHAMLDHYSHLQNHQSDIDTESVSLRSKRARLSAAAAAAAAADEPPGAAVAVAPHGPRRLWVKDRSRAWWDRCSAPDFPESEFRRAFRMSRATFDLICDSLGAAVAKEDTALRLAIPVRQRVAVCLYRLATGDPLRLVSHRFGLGISTCHKLVLEVCSAIKSLLMPQFLQWPTDSLPIKRRFRSQFGVPDVVGAMYTTHVPIIAPKVSVAAYFNRRHTERNQKTSYSVTLQGVVDPDGAFTDVCIGYPGSMPDDQILERSALHQRAAAGALAGDWIVGGANYPLTDWLLVPYTHSNLTWAQHAFNERIAGVRTVARDAFARLKGRWGCLQRRTEVKLQDLPVVLGACCVLHNICEMRKEGMDVAGGFELVDDEMVPENGVRSAAAVQTRDKIAHELLHHGHAGTAFL